MSEKQEFIWVTGARGRPVHNNAIFKGEYYDISITQEMVDNDVPVKMPNTTNFHTFLSQGIVKVAPDAKDAEAKLKAWEAKRKKAEVAVIVEKAEEAQVIKKATDDAVTTIKAELKARRKPVKKEDTE